MTTDTYIEKNKTATLKKGDKVEMFDCYEARFEKNKGRVWTCQTDSFLDKSNDEVVFLEEFSGCFITKCLKKVSSCANCGSPIVIAEGFGFLVCSNENCFHAVNQSAISNQ